MASIRTPSMLFLPPVRIRFPIFRCLIHEFHLGLRARHIEPPLDSAAEILKIADPPNVVARRFSSIYLAKLLARQFPRRSQSLPASSSCYGASADVIDLAGPRLRITRRSMNQIGAVNVVSHLFPLVPEDLVFGRRWQRISLSMRGNRAIECRSGLVR